MCVLLRAFLLSAFLFPNLTRSVFSLVCSGVPYAFLPSVRLVSFLCSSCMCSCVPSRVVLRSSAECLRSNDSVLVFHRACSYAVFLSVFLRLVSYVFVFLSNCLPLVGIPGISLKIRSCSKYFCIGGPTIIPSALVPATPCVVRSIRVPFLVSAVLTGVSAVLTGTRSSFRPGMGTFLSIGIRI